MMPRDENVTPKNETGLDSEVTDAEAAPNYRGMKILVIALGVGIVGMLALIVYTISQRAAAGLMGEQPDVIAEAPTTSAMAPAIASGDYRIQRPEGATLVSVDAKGAELIFHFRSEVGDTIIVLDRRTGDQTSVTVPLSWQGE